MGRLDGDGRGSQPELGRIAKRIASQQAEERAGDEGIARASDVAGSCRQRAECRDFGLGPDRDSRGAGSDDSGRRAALSEGVPRFLRIREGGLSGHDGRLHEV